uniref:Uncharacterized protein n=1 Tax=Romanomermis culicivorax TaxID=13658 RepID=A0A915JVT1_ROMCU
MQKKKKKKQKEQWNKLPDVFDDEDSSLKSKKVYEDPKRLQAAIASAMKNSLMQRLTNLLSFHMSLIYKLELRTPIEAINAPLLLADVHEVDGCWQQQLMATTPLTTAIASPCSTAEFAYVNDL